ncbi:type III secretion FHIPEP protein [Psychromonas ingrahamii 37]|uniref:Type III secretion FHIPEP protein n=1 Tax=Psychromonas ingrahamii (strain DSM 17664 / CCUG 51855 / 37) TaxID=357804 RepID=A1T0L5_PSYIN|nr:flagellar biosynthesis protein FlhA [Psychromonas ingrahamii]ABM05280.1 type III secretion FHIPEP protein [Psychromonas ingrahamii 37]
MELLKKFKNIKLSLAIPATLLMILAMVMLPLPPFLLDIFFTLNIVLAIIVLLVSTTTKRVLDFSVFPTLLLIATLMRLTLNVASTRIVLIEGHKGGNAAGDVIQAFGDVVIGGNYVVGMVVFIILMIINFVVITKGGERISEVSARFTLDALPGKQMAIDADLNAGLINQEQAKTRRQETGDEAEFYGSMDGASKFVRGDAIAGLLILFINLIGGVLIGIFSHDMSAAESFQTFALLTIGDGIVAQIPSLLLATSAAVIVTRVSNSDSDISQTIKKQILSTPSVLYASAGVMTIIGLVPNMPHLPFLIFAALLGFVGWQQSKIQEESQLEEVNQSVNPLQSPSEEVLDWQVVTDIEPITLTLGFKLVSLLNIENGAPLLKSIKGTRKSLSEEVGFLIPEVTIRDNLSLKPDEYVIFIDGEEMERGTVKTGYLMAVSSDDSFGSIDGIIGQDPAYLMPALWITPENKSLAINYGYQVISLADVIATHINKVLSANLASIFNYDDIKAMNDKLGLIHPQLSESLSAAVTPGLQLQIIKNLLIDQVPVKNKKVIANTILDSINKTKDPILISSDVRAALKRTILSLISPDSKTLDLFVLSSELDNILRNAIAQVQTQNPQTSLDEVPIDPNLLAQLQQNLPNITQQMMQQGLVPILLVSPTVRPMMSKFSRAFSRDLIVLSFNEIADDYQINAIGNLD